MTIYNKLKIAILAVLSSQPLHAITLDPLQIQSAPGELLYAEMSFHQADPESKLEVSLATPEDLLMIGDQHHPPSQLNFFIRHNNQGEGVIVITSSRPIIDPELNIILKIQEGHAAHLKHIRQPIRSKMVTTPSPKSNEQALTPKFIVSEKDIALNLPESTHFNATASGIPNEPDHLKQEKVLNAPFSLPPTLDTSASETLPAESVKVAAADQTTQPIVSDTQIQTSTSIATAADSTVEPQATQQPTPNHTDNISITQNHTLPAQTETEVVEKQPVPQKTEHQAQLQNATPAIQKKMGAAQTTASNDKIQQHTVKRNESLWSISQQIAVQTQQPVAQIMQQIKAQNEHAFIGGNANRLRQGVHLNFNLAAIATTSPQQVNQTSTQTPPSVTRKAKYRLQQAEMSLVAESDQDSSTGSAKKDTLKQKNTADLSLKILTARKKTVTLQRNVTQLELALGQKEQRIQLLNARLAELQEQLKAQQETKKPTR